ncbi:MAG: hypothetical protein M5R41_03675 [Bacteroidia bacterium]|nr:hypothetical protein [Bacteroidia bacterium]
MQQIAEWHGIGVSTSLPITKDRIRLWTGDHQNFQQTIPFWSHSAEAALRFDVGYSITYGLSALVVSQPIWIIHRI